jgi:hypothetical protein
VTDVLALDPGNVRSALIGLRGRTILFTRHDENEVLRKWLYQEMSTGRLHYPMALVIEQVACMGMAVGETVFETVFWSGRFAEIWTTVGGPVARMPRHAVKLALCHNTRAKDANIRQRLIDLYGGPAAIGRKATPGPLYAVKADLWAALALGLAYQQSRGVDVGLVPPLAHDSAAREVGLLL